MSARRVLRNYRYNMDHIVLNQFLDHENARPLNRATRFSVGYDLFPVEEFSIAPNSNKVIETGVRIILPPGCYGKIESRSGLAVRKLLSVVAGVIDPDYTGTLKVVMFNLGTKTVQISSNTAIAQLILIRCFTPVNVMTLKSLEEYESLHATIYQANNRRDNGFGSTDVCLSGKRV